MPKLRVVDKKAGAVAKSLEDVTVLYDDACGIGSEVVGDFVILMLFDQENFIRVKVKLHKSEIKTLAEQFAAADKLLSLNGGVMQ